MSESTAVDIEVQPAAVDEATGQAPAVEAVPADSVPVENPPADAGSENDGSTPSAAGEPHDVRRMKKFIQKTKELESENAVLKSVLEKLTASGSSAQSVPQSSAADTPQRENYSSEEDFIQASINHGIERAKVEIRTELQASAHSSDVANRMSEARKTIRDFDSVVDAARDEVKNFETLQAFPLVAKSEHSAELIYEIAKDPEYADKIVNGMSIEQASYAIGRLEAKIEARKTKPTGRTGVTNAPAPITPLSTRGESSPKDPSKMTDAEWFQWDLQQKRKRKR